jgi:DNA-binding NtrC family response regulator
LTPDSKMETKSILIVDDEAEIRSVLLETLSKNGHRILQAGDAQEALNLFEQEAIDLVITDVKMPGKNGIDLLKSIKKKSLGTPVVLMTGFGSVQNAVEAMKSGALEYLMKPFSLQALEQLIQKALGEDRFPQDLSPSSPNKSRFSLPIMTKDRRMKDILDLCLRVAASKATVLIQGESGTGKELFSRYIHSHSSRREGPFVAVNCASLPETLLESELFGHEKGSFTGAIGKKIGKFELAQEGTILLDEISEMNPLLQAKILRVLQEGEVDRIGGRQPISIDVRVIATTNRNLEEAIAQGEFREDLYYRLNVISIKLHPLRERPEDIEFLSVYFLKMFAKEYRRPVHSISEEALAWLKKQEWRGNVRELRNIIERAVLMSDQNVLQVSDVSCDSPLEPKGNPQGVSAGVEFPSLSLRDMEEKLIMHALEKTNGNRTHAAKMLGISIRTLRNKLNEYKQGLEA